MYRSEQIREARERLGMTQETLAEEIGVSRQAVSKWEMGASEPSLENLQALSQVLGVEFANAPGDTPAEIKNPWKGCCLILGCLLLASLLALGAALLPQETPAEDAGAPGTAGLPRTRRIRTPRPSPASPSLTPKAARSVRTWGTAGCISRQAVRSSWRSAFRTTPPTRSTLSPCF